MELSAFASGASKELSAIIKLIRDLIRIDHLIAKEMDKREIRKLCSDLRVLYFEPTGVRGAIRTVLEKPPETGAECLSALSLIRGAYSDRRREVDESLERVRSLNARENLEIGLDVFELTWRVGLGKGRSAEVIDSFLRYALLDLDEYGNQPKLVTAHLQVIAEQVDNLNAEIAVLESSLKKLA
jgi:hypothetical protein